MIYGCDMRRKMLQQKAKILAGSIIIYKGCDALLGKVTFAIVSHKTTSRQDPNNPGSMMIEILGHPEAIGDESVWVS